MGPQGRRHAELREAYSTQSVAGGLAGAMAQDEYPTLQRIGGIKPRPTTIHETSQSSGAYARLPQE